MRSNEILTRKKQSKLCEGLQARLGGTQDVRVDSEQRAPILKLMMKISNKMKTAAKGFDVFLKENEVKFGIGKVDMWHFNLLQWEEKLQRLVIPSRFVVRGYAHITLSLLGVLRDPSPHCNHLGIPPQCNTLII